MGAFQLPDSVLADASICLVYSFLCLVANCLLVWLIWTHHERTSYVAFIAYFALLATVSSIVQQIFDYSFWRDVMTEQFYYGQEHAQDAEVQYQNEIFGLKLALSYVRIFSIIVEASLVFFFSFSLAATVYGWWAKKPRSLRNLSIVGRVVPIALAVITIILLQLDITHQSFTVYMVVANAQYILALLGSCIFLLMILFKYLQSRQQLRTWQAVQYGKGGSRSTITTQSGWKSRRSRAFSTSTSNPSSSTFDNWLVVRLTIAFLTLCVFEYTNISPRLSARRKVLESLAETAPDLSEKRAMATVTGYLSGVSPSMLAFLVFGTTKTFQRKMYRTFIPSFLRRKNRGRDVDLIGYHHGSSHLTYYPPTTANSSRTRASTTFIDTPPRRPLSHKSSVPSSIRRPETAVQHHRLGPIHEPDRVRPGQDDDDDDDDDRNKTSLTPAGASIRRSQIGLAISVPPPPSAHGTFLRDEGDTDSLDSLANIPMSRFNNSATRRGEGDAATITTVIWSESRRGSEGALRTSTQTRHYGPPPPRRGSDV